MARRKTLQEIEADIKKQEERIKRLKAQQEELTRAETAKINKKILEAVKRWNEAQFKPVEWEDLPDRLNKLADKYERQRREEQEPKRATAEEEKGVEGEAPSRTEPTE